MNADRIIAQAREWAALACALTEIDADLRTFEAMRKTWHCAVDKLWKAQDHARGPILPTRWYYDRRGCPVPVYEAPPAAVSDELARELERAAGAWRALCGLARIWSEVEDRREFLFDHPAPYDAVRRGFTDCADGLAAILAASQPFEEFRVCVNAARDGAQVLFEELAR